MGRCVSARHWTYQRYMLIRQTRSAEDPTYFVASRSDVPLQSGFKPNVTVLSRKPTPTVISKKDPVSGIEQLKIQDDEDEENNQTNLKPLTVEERALKAQKEREEKQRKYDEARERLFGSSVAPPGTTPPRSTTPVKGSGTDKSKGRGRGGEGKDSKDSRDGRPSSSSLSGKSKQLFDPNSTPKPDSIYQQRKEAASNAGTPSLEDQIIRQPRGPDGSGRDGFGFTERAGQKS